MSVIAVEKYEPDNVAVSPDGTHVYVAYYGNRVIVIDSSTNSVVDAVSMQDCFPIEGMAFNLSGTRLYVACQSNDNVNVIDTSNNKVVATVVAGHYPKGVAIGPAVTTTNCNTVVTNGLVACYPFDGNAKDASGNRNNGTVNGATLTADRFGKQNSAYRFNGINDVILANNPFAPTMTDTDPFSVSVWINTTNTDKAGGIVSQHTACDRYDNDHFYIELYGATANYNQLKTNVYDSMGKSVPIAVVADGKWHHVTLVYEKVSQNLQTTLYIDGNIQGSANVTPVTGTPKFDPITKIAIGGFASNVCPMNQNFQGVIDDVRIYNRALTEAEIKQLYTYTGSSTEIVATSPDAICKDSSFDVTIKAKTTSAIDGVQFDLKFDPTKLKVNKITNSGKLDAELPSSYDNTAGTIQFAAGVWDNPVPTSDFDVFTINFTALGAAGTSTILDFLDSSIVTANGDPLGYSLKDQTLSFSQCLSYKVNLQRAVAKPADSWKTELKASLGTDASAAEYSTTCDNSGLGKLILNKSLVTGEYFCVKNSHTLAKVTGEYFCVKNSHTLANKVAQPFGNPIDFGTLLEGDANNDNKVDILDQTLLLKSRGCKSVANYNPQADFNVSDCVDTADLNLLTANFNKLSDCKLNTTLKMYRNRKGQRDGDRQTVGFSATTLPTDLKVGNTFDYTIQVNATEAQAADGAAVYLNFDPAKLKVNHLVGGQSFDVELENSFDNDKGEINFAAGVWDNPAPTQKVELVTINLTLLEIGGEQTLSFSTTEERQTMIAAGGEEVTALDNEGNPIVELIAPKEPPPVVGNYSAHGTLKDKVGNPLSGVTVQIGDKTAISGANGYWEINELTEGNYSATFSKDGVTFVDQAFELGNGVNAELNAMPINSLKAIVKADKFGAILQGDNLRYTITVLNGGQVLATGVMLTENVPTGAVIAVFQSDNGVCDLNTATCTLADLAPGASATVTLELSNLPSTGAAFANEVSLKSNEYPVDVVKNWAKVKPYLSLLGKSIPNPVEMGKQLHYQLVAELLNNAPETTANGVTAEITLPPEVKFLQATATQGNCAPNDHKVTCQIGDLSVAQSDAISRVDINVDVELIDLGLLQLNAETKIFAANYPEHREIVRTALYLANVEVDGAILLDVTGSMGEELEAVKRAIKEKLAKQYENGAKPLIALVTFRDAVKFEAASTDLNVILQALEKLVASGGGLCPEASAESLDLALNHLKPNGIILMATDAPPYSDADIEALKAKIVAKQANFIPILTKSDCESNALTQ